MIEVTGLYAAFFIGKGNWANALIRWRSGDDSSHCEVVQRVYSDGGRLWGECHGSSIRDKGVRPKLIDLTHGWDVVPCPDSDAQVALDFFAANKGTHYDFFAWVGAAIGWAWLQFGGWHTCSEYARRCLCPDAPLDVGMYPGALRQWLTRARPADRILGVSE